MLNSLVSELSGILEILQRCDAVEHFTLAVAASRLPLPSSVATLIDALLMAVIQCHSRLRAERPFRQSLQPMHFNQPEPSDSFNFEPLSSDRQDWVPVEDYRLDEPQKPEAPAPIQPIPECLEALNLSVAASPECLEAINLSVATSPCYNPIDEPKNMNEVGNSLVFWDPLALDVNNPECFASDQSTANLNNDGMMEFTHDIDSTSVLGDGYILDISSQVSVTDALNASIYFGLHREQTEIAASNTDPAAALDLSHPGTMLRLPENVQETSEVENYTCATCGKVLRSKASLKRHQFAHSDGHVVCDHCGKAFRGAWLLRRHVLAHISVHVCEICGKRCMDDRNLKRHVAIHSTGTFSCSSCRKTFSRPDALKRHMDIIHLKSREFSCRYCQKTFSVKCNLLSHLDSVHGGEPIMCTVCEKSCKNKATYQKHMKTHGAPALACSICKKSFHRRPQYKRHMKNQHGIQNS